MSAEQFESNWFDPLPLEHYAQLVADNIPTKSSGRPANISVGTPKIEIACGPTIRFVGCLEDGKPLYRATILLVTKGDVPSAPSMNYVIGPAFANSTLKLQSGQFPVVKLDEIKGYTFWRFTVELTMTSYEQKIKYGINGDFNTSYQFFIPSTEQSMNSMSYSCNGFSVNVDLETFNGCLWFDVLKKHDQLHYHVMLGGGDQIYCDSIKFTSKEFEKFLKHKNLHSKRALTPEMAESFDDYYLNHYMEWFGYGYSISAKGDAVQPCYPIALHQIPQVNVYDDHDIIDGFGSYKDSTMSSEVFLGLGKYAFRYYMLFQQHTRQDEDPKLERSWIEGAIDGPFIKQKSRSIYARLGKEVALAGLDCRAERTQKKILSSQSYSNIFGRLSRELEAANGEIKHLLVMLGVPILYPRMVWAEAIMESKMIAPVKYLAKKGVIKGLVNEFDGSVELLDDLNDHWCAKGHKKERNWLMGEFVKFSAKYGVRITILSGDVHLCAISRFKSKLHNHLLASDETKHENMQILTSPDHDPRLIFNVISSAIINAPPPDGMALLLNKRSKIHHFDRTTDEDVVPLFSKEVDGGARANELFMNKRNFSSLIPMKNLKALGLDQRYSQFQKGDLILPGSSDSLKKIDVSTINTSDAVNVGYTYDDDSLVASLHVEVDRTKPESKTTAYEVLVPKLVGPKDLGKFPDRET